jgi:hypothetical protein
MMGDWIRCSERLPKLYIESTPGSDNAMVPFLADCSGRGKRQDLVKCFGFRATRDGRETWLDVTSISFDENNDHEFLQWEPEAVLFWFELPEHPNV